MKTRRRKLVGNYSDVARERNSKTKVSELVAEYKADPNCRPNLWIGDCLSKGEVSQKEHDEFLLAVLTDTWQKAYKTTLDVVGCKERLSELEAWDNSGSEIERLSKMTALRNLIG